MASRARRRSEGPRRATRWIGEALVLDGDLSSSTGAPAVWRGDKEPRCARVRIEDVSRDWEFGVDEATVQLAAAQVVGPAIVRRFATYCDDEVETVVVVEEELGGVRLRSLIHALAQAGGDVPVGLVAYVGRELVRASLTAGDVRVHLDPRRVDVTWAAAVLSRPNTDPRDVDELRWEDDGVERVLYADNADEPTSRLVVLGALLYELLAGRHPYDVDVEGDDEDDEVRIDAILERIEQRAFDVLTTSDAVSVLAQRLLRGEIDDVDDVRAALDDVLAHEPFGAPELAGMLRGLFPGMKERDDVERDDRIAVLPGPKVEPETWAALDLDIVGRDTAGYETLDLRDVRRGRAGRDDYEPPYEPSVPPVDPFDDE